MTEHVKALLGTTIAAEGMSSILTAIKEIAESNLISLLGPRSYVGSVQDLREERVRLDSLVSEHKTLIDAPHIAITNAPNC